MSKELYKVLFVPSSYHVRTIFVPRSPLQARQAKLGRKKYGFDTDEEELELPLGVEAGNIKTVMMAIECAVVEDGQVKVLPGCRWLSAQWRQ